MASTEGFVGPNAFPRNVAVECDRYGYRFEATSRDEGARLRPIVRGTTVDDGPVRRVLVNGSEPGRLAPDFLEWEAVLDHQTGAPEGTITAFAADAAGHVEPRPHVVRLR